MWAKLASGAVAWSGTISSRGGEGAVDQMGFKVGRLFVGYNRVFLEDELLHRVQTYWRDSSK